MYTHSKIMVANNNFSPVIKMFLKFGNKENIEDLYNNGTIFMNSIQYFHSLEDLNIRGDKYEGAISIKNTSAGSFEIPVLNFKGNYKSLHLKERFDTVLGNIYSLYCISSLCNPNPYNFSMDERVKSFGTHCLMVMQNAVFLKRIEKALQKKNLKYTHGFVSYYDRYKFNGKITLFQKPMEYSYQNEFRFYVETDNILPIILNIGTMSDISQIVSTEAIMTLKIV